MLLMCFISPYHHIGRNRFDVMQQDLFTVAIITKYNHSRGAWWMHSIYSGVVELHMHTNTNTHTQKHATTHKHTSSKLTISSKQLIVFSVGVIYVCIIRGTTPAGQRMKRASVQWSAIRWTAGQQEACWGLSACVCVHPHMHARR